MPFKKGVTPKGAVVFVKGKSGNPKGKTKGSKNRNTTARYWLEVTQKAKNPITSKEQTLSQEDLGTLAMVKKMRNGDVNAYKALLDSAYGRPTEMVELNAETKNKITVNFGG